MPVNDIHPEYKIYQKEWQRTEDAAIGSPRLRKRPLEYLPEPYARDEPERYAAFVQRAYYTNYTGRTERVLSGMVLRKPADYQLPPAVQALLEDFDGQGNSIDQIAKRALTQRMRKNRFVFLVDYPSAKPDLSSEEEARLGLRPIVAPYDAESLINWRFKSVGGKKRLVLAVLREMENVSPDEFGHDYKERFRVLRLRDGVYTQQVFDDRLAPLTDEFAPLQAGGLTFDHIPLHGVRDLNVAPLQPIAELNLAHYWNTAKLEDLVDVLGSPNLHINVGETSVQEWAANNPGEFKLGGRIGTLTKGGRMDIVQAEERPLIRTVRIDKAEGMAAIGAAIAMKGGGAETAEAARIRAGSETSMLDSLVGDLSEDIEASLEDMARFVGADPGQVFYGLNTDFFDTGLTAQELQVVIQGQILYGSNAALHMIRQGRIELPSDMTNEELQADAASVLPDASLL